MDGTNPHAPPRHRRAGLFAVALTAAAVALAVHAPQAPAATLAATLQVTNAGHGTVTSTPPGIACGVVCTASFAPLSVVTLTAVPDPGYVVAWSGDCAAVTAPQCTVSMTANKAVTATFHPTLTVVLKDIGNPPSPIPRGWVTSFGATSPEGIDCGDTCVASFPAGTVVTLWPVVLLPASVFSRWESNVPAAAVDCPSFLCVVTLTEPKHVTVVFNAASGPVEIETSFSVAKTGTGGGTVRSRPPGIVCGPPDNRCSFGYPSNMNVKLTATADNGSTFAGWGGPCAGAGTRPTCVATVGPAVGVTARFERESGPPDDPPDPPEPPKPKPPDKPTEPASTTITTGGASVRVLRSQARRTVVLRMTLRTDAAGTVRLLRRGKAVLARTLAARAGETTLRLVVPRRIRSGPYRVALALSNARGRSERLSWRVNL